MSNIGTCQLLFYARPSVASVAHDFCFPIEHVKLGIPFFATIFLSQPHCVFVVDVHRLQLLVFG